MKIHSRIIIVIAALSAVLLSSCVPAAMQGGTDLQNQNSPLTASKTPFQPSQTTLYLSAGIPEEWRSAIETISEVKIVPEKETAELIFTAEKDGEGQTPLFTSKLIFAAAVPFLTVDDDISPEEINALWKGSSQSEDPYQTLIVSESTRAILSDMWGENSPKVLVTAEDSLLSAVETTEHAVAVIPFEKIDPRWKILKINEISPLDKPFNEQGYPLAATYYLLSKSTTGKSAENTARQISELIPSTNRDEAKMTVIVMSGTTAMARGTAAKINAKGTDYPIEKVKDWFLSADLRHVSNEISFDSDCPIPDPYTSSLRFCANPKHIEVLEKLGVNVVELTGNHENDYGAENFAATLKMYAERGWNTFGGGDDPESARKPLLIENNGNKIAFIGCNPVGPNNAWVSEEHAGVANCDFDYLHAQIKELKEQGYVVISTFQHNEIYEYMYSDLYREDFRNSVQAGADIVQGSQAHYPMGFELIGNSLIHYGLGNFLFDQMDYPVVGTRREFVDRHIIYNGKYINTELLTALLTDWSRPVPMSKEDRAQFLSDIFEASKKRWP